jgi:glutamate--cysteine ligase
VEYVEVRALDLNCHSKNGVDTTQLRFLEAFLIFCLLEESPVLTKKELSDIEYNELTVALRGHEPNLELIDSSKRRKIKTWSLEICDRMLAICECLDSETENSHYVRALKKQIEAISHPEILPAAKILQTLIDNQEPFQTYAMNLSKDYAKHYRETPAPKDFAEKFYALAHQSHAEQTALENANETSLDNYISNYIKN